MATSTSTPPATYWSRRFEADAGRSDPYAVTRALELLDVLGLEGVLPELWAPFDAAVARLPPDFPGLWRVQGTGQLHGRDAADLVRASVAGLGQLDVAISGLHEEADPRVIIEVSSAAFRVDRLAGCRAALGRVVQDVREGAAIGTHAMGALACLSHDDFRRGTWDEAWQLADEGLRLCEDYGHPLEATSFLYFQALVAAGRGDDDTARALTGQITRWAVPRGARRSQATACHAAALGALGRGDFEEAYQQAAAVSPPGVLVARVRFAIWLVMDLVEAAVRSGRRAEAAAHVAAMREAGIAALSPRFALLACGSAAMAAPDDRAGPLFAGALAIPGADRWPFDYARVQLAYGEHLRRARAATRARAQLSAAHDTFQHLGARPWAARAASELRAAGQVTPRPDGHGPASLTAQEREIALLAAEGLTNRQIGERLYLSHRTVGSHLYQIFPKLGITSRAALRDALASLPAEPRGREPRLGP